MTDQRTPDSDSLPPIEQLPTPEQIHQLTDDQLLAAYQAACFGSSQTSRELATAMRAAIIAKMKLATELDSRLNAVLDQCNRDDAIHMRVSQRTGPAKIYVASSWRNPHQREIVQGLRRWGHEVYDFKNPKPDDFGFSWTQVSEVPPKDWTADDYIQALEHPRALQGFNNDFSAMLWADTFVLVLPCGRSAHLELGWAVGQGKRCYVLLEEKIDEPELMYLIGAKLLTSVEQLREELSFTPQGDTKS